MITDHPVIKSTFVPHSQHLAGSIVAALLLWWANWGAFKKKIDVLFQYLYFYSIFYWGFVELNNLLTADCTRVKLSQILTELKPRLFSASLLLQRELRWLPHCSLSWQPDRALISSFRIILPIPFWGKEWWRGGMMFIWVEGWMDKSIG